MESQEINTSPETTMKEVFCTFEKEKEKCEYIRPETPIPSQEQIKNAYVKNIINAVKWSDLDSFISLLTPDTAHYAYLYEYNEIPLIEYLFIQYQASKTGARQRILLKMALHLSTLIDTGDINNFYEALGYTQEQVEIICQKT